MRPFFVYIIECGEGSFYVGHTDNLERRWAQHQAGTFRDCFTLERQPLRLVFVCAFATRRDALERERQLKGWSRAKKLALIESDWQAIHEYTRTLGRSKKA